MGAGAGMIGGAWGSFFATKTATSVIVAGALAGAASGGIATGPLKGALQGAVFGAISGGIAHGIGESFGHGGGLFDKGSFNLSKHLTHGLSRAAIGKAQGGTWSGGFWSGLASSALSPGTTMGGSGAGGFTLRTTIAGVVGGTASELGGGKFANGAVSGAFTHMFNVEAGSVAKARRIKALLKGAHDGHLSLEEANAHFVYGQGEPIYVDASKLTVHKYQIAWMDRTIVAGDDYYVHGQVTIDNDGKILAGDYDFDIKHKWYNPVIIARNIGTIGGLHVAGGIGTPFKVYYIGKPKVITFR